MILNFNMTMKILLLCLVLTVAFAPATVRAQTNRSSERPELQRLREELRDMTPEQRQARIRELRERGAMPKPVQIPGQSPAAKQPAGFGGRGAGIERIAMVLTPEQRDSMRQYSMNSQKEAAGLEEKIQEARKAALNAALEETINTDDLRLKLEAVSKLETEITILRVKAFAKMEPPLSAEQKEQIKNPPPMSEALRNSPPRRPMDQPGEGQPGDKLNLPPPQ